MHQPRHQQKERLQNITNDRRMPATRALYLPEVRGGKDAGVHAITHGKKAVALPIVISMSIAPQPSASLAL